MSDLIEKRDERTRKRKRMKRKMDSIIGLSFHDKDKKVMSVTVEPQKMADSKARLIDEGYIDNGFVIKKGTLEKYLNGQNQYVRGWEFNGEEWEQTEVLNLTSDFVGTVNLGHMDFSVMPFILGEWTKEDLSLVDIENDRKALDVSLHLDEESVFVKELKRQSHDIGISAEFWVHENKEDTEALSETLGYYLPVFDEIYIFAYGLVGECGNVNSSGLELKGEPMKEELKELLEEETLEEEKEELGVEEVEIPPTDEEEAEEEVAEDVSEPSDESSDEEEPTEPTEETELTIEDNEPAEEEADEAEESEEESEESDEADVEEAEDGDEDDGDEAEEANEEELAIVAGLREQIQTLTNRISELEEANAKLKKTNRKLSSKYQNELDKKQKFKEELKGLSVELLPDEDKKEEEQKLNVTERRSRNGIGEI